MLELLAMMTMLVDHTGLYIFGNESWMRIVGRIAMPIYAFGIAMGYRHTKDRKKYFIRLGVIALLSQIPFGLLHENFFYLNIIFTFIIGLSALMLIEKVNKIYGKIGIAIGAMFLSELMPVEYGSYAIALILMYHYIKDYWLLFFHIMINVVYFQAGMLSSRGLFSVMGTLFLLLLHDKKSLRVNRTFYRAFYPLQFAIIYGYVYFFSS